ncbi:MAG: FHA domain-containing protein [Myxococcales bacterium]|nr:FHA domain-containing protein [Myxococcales bacterium]
MAPASDRTNLNQSTDPLARVEAGPLPPSDAVTQIKVFGDELTFHLDRTRFAFTLGSGIPTQIDLSLPHQYVSRLHARLERDGNWLVVTNHSQNGTYFGGRREERAPLLAGERFTVGATELLALDDHLVALRVALQRALGYDAHAVIDQALVDVAQREQPPLLVTGPQGSEPELLAAALHRASPRRDQPFVVLDALMTRTGVAAALARVEAGSMFVDLRPLRGKHASAHLVTALFGPRARARAIVAAPTLESALGSLAERARRLEEIQVPPISARPSDVPALLDALLVELGSVHRFAELPVDRQEAMVRFAWPDNQLDLRRTAPRLGAYLGAGGNVSAAARVLAVDSTTLSEALERVGVLVRQRRRRGPEGR